MSISAGSRVVVAKLMEARELALGAISRLTKSEELPPKEDEFVFVEESDAQVPVVPQPVPEPEPEPVSALVGTPSLSYCVRIKLPAGLVRNPKEPWKLDNPEDIWHERILIGATRSGSKAKCSFYDNLLRSCVTVDGVVV